MSGPFESPVDGALDQLDPFEQDVENMGVSVAESKLADPGYERPNDPVHPDRPWKILVVDDNLDIDRVIERLLKKHKYDTICATDGQEAVDLACIEHPDLILLDWMLPVLDGLDVCRALKRDPETRDIMIVMVTGRGSVDHRIAGFDAGADDFIPKPFKHPELLARVRSALRIKQLTLELEQRNEALLASQNELVRQEKMATIGLLASGIAHEFNNIMAGISGYAQLAKKRPKYLEQLVDVALTQAERAEELTTSLSSYHRQNSFEAASDVRDVIQRAFCLVKKLIESEGINLTLEASPGLVASISPGQLQEIVLNMVLNAIHAIEGGGEISVLVTHQEADDSVRIEISDTGKGIDPEHLNVIFDPFFTTKGALGGGSQKGTGLGLSVCYNIVQSQGGKITVESEVDSGTTFFVTLPRSTETIDLACEGGVCFPADNAQPTQKLRVLIVDDEGPIRSVLREFLSDHEVLCCATGEEALRAYAVEPYDFVILDICMEGSQGGIETLRQLKQNDPEARAILASGRLKEEIPENVLEVAHGHLLKPFKLDALAALLGIPVPA